MKKGTLRNLLIVLVIAAILSVPVIMAGKGGRHGGGGRQCNDNVDNDGDGLTDWPADPGCSKKKDRTETDPNLVCDNGLDDDGDQLIDMADPGCSSPTDNDETDAAVCGNGVVEGGEVCDGTDLNGETCPSQGHDGGTLACLGDCSGFDASSCWDNTCSDTDGGNQPWIAGTTSGDFQSNPYSSDDTCASADDVIEYYCSGNVETSQQQNCGTDASVDFCRGGDVWTNSTDYFCSTGACGVDVSQTLKEACSFGCTNGACDSAPDSCSDTDGGFFPLVAGTVSGNSGGSLYSNSDSCADSTTVTEWYCNGASAFSWDTTCAGNLTGTCSNGACV